MWNELYGVSMLQTRDLTWPQLRIPQTPKITLSNRILLCYFCYRTGCENQWVCLGRREIQTRFCRVGGPRVSKKIRELHRQELLERRKPRATPKAYEYRLSKKFLSESSSDDWKHLSNVLFAEEFQWRALFDRPFVGHGFLNFSGVLVLGSILSTPKGIFTAELQNYLRGLLGEQTVRKAVHRLECIEVVMRNPSGELVTTADWLGRLDDYEKAAGSKERARRLGRQIKAERKSFFGL